MKIKNIVFSTLIVLLVFGVLSYNNLISLSEEVNIAWSGVENQMQRRVDLIPNLVNTVKGYSNHEKDIFKDLALARKGAKIAKGVDEVTLADERLTNAFSGFNIIVEDNPEIMANENFKGLQVQLEGTENRMAYARTKYNETVAIYNKKIKKLPYRILARVYGFEEKQYMKANEKAKEPVEVEF